MNTLIQMQGTSMDAERKAQDLTLVFTCSDLYVDQIEAAVMDGEIDYLEIMQYNDTLPRCGECVDHIGNITDKLLNRDIDEHR